MENGNGRQFSDSKVKIEPGRRRFRQNLTLRLRKSVKRAIRTAWGHVSRMYIAGATGAESLFLGREKGSRRLTAWHRGRIELVFFFRGSARRALSIYGSGEPEKIRLKRPFRLIGPNRPKSPFKGLQSGEKRLELNFEFWILNLNFEFWISKFEFSILNFEFQLELELWNLNFEFWILNLNLNLNLNFEIWILNFEFWIWTWPWTWTLKFETTRLRETTRDYETCSVVLLACNWCHRTA